MGPYQGTTLSLNLQASLGMKALLSNFAVMERSLQNKK